MDIKRVNAGQGWQWIRCGWGLFAREFGTWFVMFLVLLAIAIVLNFVPLVGGAALAVITPALVAGYLYAASELDNGRRIEVGQLFHGFRDKPLMNRLLILGAMYLVAELVLGLVALGTVGGSMMMNMPEEGQVNVDLTLSTGTLLASLVILALALVIAMAFVFAPALVLFDDATPLDAAKASFRACLQNIAPLLVFGIIYIGLAIVAAIPVGLGFLILIPVSILAVYCSYRSIFH